MHKGTERDGLGGGGEGPHHEKLRLWVQKNPKKIAPRLGNVRSETEQSLLSGDRVDVVYFSPTRTLAIEVKSKDSNWADHQRGIYQCVKYKKILEVQDGREAPPVDALLVTEKDLDGFLKNLAQELGVRHRVVKVNR